MGIFTTYESWTHVPYSSEYRNNLIEYGKKSAEEVFHLFTSHRDAGSNHSETDKSDA